MPSKFFHDLFLSLGIEKYQNLSWRSFFRDGFWLNLLCSLCSQDFSKIYDTNDPNVILDIILEKVDSSLDQVAPLKEIKFRDDKPKLSLRKDTFATMQARDIARKSGQKDLYKQLRNKVTKLVKCDQIQRVLLRLGTKPGSKTAWRKAKQYLGSGKNSKLPECTNNADPRLTAENQNSYFINKIEELVSSIPKSRIVSVKC